jgi:hypothetical protein
VADDVGGEHDAGGRGPEVQVRARVWGASEGKRIAIRKGIKLEKDIEMVGKQLSSRFV